MQNTKEFFERPDIKGCHFLKSMMNDQQFKERYINNGNKTQKEINDKFKLIKNYVNSAIGYKQLNIKYDYGNGSNGYGRLYGHGSIQNVNSVFRGLLFKHTTDIDIKNCHPVILKWLCDKYEIKCCNLNQYIFNREEVFKSNGGKDFVKNKVLNLMNNDFKNKKGLNTQFLKDIDIEFNKIRQQIIYKEKYQDILQNIDETQQGKNYAGTCISRILCHYESQILNEMVYYLQNNNYVVSVLMFDGCMIEGNHYDNFDLLKSMETFINSKFENINIELQYKEHDNSIVIPDDFTFNHVKIVDTDYEAGEYFFDKYKHILKSYKGRLFFKKDNIWLCDEKQISNTLSVMILKDKVFKMNKDGLVAFCQNLKGANNILDVLTKMIREDNNDDELYEKFHNSTRDLLCFNDGVYFFKKSKFVKWVDIDEDVYSCIKINRDFEHYYNNPDLEVIEELKKKMFIDAYGDKTDEFFHFLSRAMSGNVQDKRYATYLGNRNCGKSAEYDLLKRAFGDYVNTFEISNILYSKNSAGFENLDASKKLYWLMDLEFTRMAVSQEVPESKSGFKVNSKILKKISGGSDEIVARRNYDRQDTHFTIDTTFYMKGNDPLVMDSNDCNETRLEYHSVLKYASNVEIENMVERGFDKLEIQKYKTADPLIKDKCKTEQWGNALIYLVIQNYKDYAVSKRNNDDIDDDETNDFFNDLKKCYTITNNHDDVVLCDTLHEDLEKYDKKIIKNELQNVNVFKVRCKKRGEYRDKNVYTGIKINDMIDVEM